MKVILGILVIFVLSLVASRLIRYKRFLPLELKNFFYTYSEFLVLGFLIGPYVLGLLKQEFLENLNPFLYLGLGWAGILFGLQFDFQRVKRFSPRLYGISFSQSFITFIVSSSGFFFLCCLVTPLVGADRLLMAFLFGTVACISGPVAVAHFLETRKSEDNDSMLLEFVSSVDGVVGVLIFGVLTSFFHRIDLVALPVVNSLVWFVLSIFLGVILAMGFHAIIRERTSQQELFLYLVGMLILSSSIAYTLSLSPLFVNFVIGLVLSNLSLKREIIIRHIASIEKPMYILFLLLAGARWSLDLQFGYVVGMIIVFYISMRMLGKLVGFRIGTMLFKLPFIPKPFLGVGLFSQGAVALTMLININLIYSGFYLQMLTSLILLALLVNEILAPFMIRKALETTNTEGKIAKGNREERAG